VAVTGAHMLLYTPEPEALRAVFRDVFGWRYVEDAPSGGGWLIFQLPPAELGVHPSEGETGHKLSLMCDDVHATLDELREHGLEADGEPQDLGFGIGSTLTLPGGVEVLLYEPRHASPLTG
jgi:catechol 2,3-dioxygenase-like lactoylglutathione lyase family enzyme